MACLICTFPIGVGVNHKLCLIRLFKSNKIQNVREWEKMCEVKEVKIIRKRLVVLPPPS
jgi:hypothetical protein